MRAADIDQRLQQNSLRSVHILGLVHRRSDEPRGGIRSYYDQATTYLRVVCLTLFVSLHDHLPYDHLTKCAAMDKKHIVIVEDDNIQREVIAEYPHELGLRFLRHQMARHSTISCVNGLLILLSSICSFGC